MITIEELKLKIDNNSRLLGLDLGSKKVGISICDENKIVATPYKTVNYTNIKNLIIEINIIIKENNIKGVIIGYPINMDGSLGKSSQSIRDKAIEISNNIKIPVCLWDERLSTVGSFNLSSQLDINTSKRIKNIDEKAAAFILQGAIDYLNN
tara:strand:+ start:3416 stop:3871 length:456 start_codon:yes stop_codon:yes gene_type:complete